MRRHHKHSNLKKSRGNPHGNAPAYKQPIRGSSDENLRQTVRSDMSEEAMKNKQ